MATEVKNSKDWGSILDAKTDSSVAGTVNAVEIDTQLALELAEAETKYNLALAEFERNKKALANRSRKEEETDVEQSRFSDDSDFSNEESDTNQVIGADIKARMRAQEIELAGRKDQQQNCALKILGTKAQQRSPKPNSSSASSQ